MKRKNSSLGELINNFSSLMKYRMGISEPPKRNKFPALAVVSIASGVALGLAGGLLFSQETGRENRKKISKLFKNASRKTADYTTREINRLNELTKQQK